MLDDLQQAFRSIKNNTTMMLAAILSIAIGIASVSAIVGLISSVITGAFPGIDQPSRVVWVLRGQGGISPDGDALPGAEYVALKAESTTLQSLSAFQPTGGALSGAGDAQQVSGMAVTGSYFEMLGARAALGRALGHEDEPEGAEPAMVLSDSFHRKAFGGDRGVIGARVQLRGQPYRVVGVMPRGFDFLGDVDVFVPLHMSPQMQAERNSTEIIVLGRIAEKSSIAAVNTELAAIAARRATIYPDSNRGVSIGAMTLTDLMLGPRRNLSGLLALGALLVLAIACANVASLLLAAGAARRGEMAIRAALGADRGRVVRQLLVESLVIAVIGGVIGLGLAWVALRGFAASVPPGFAGRVPGLARASLDGVGLMAGLISTLVASLGAGLMPALRASDVELTELLRDGARGSGVSRERRRLLRFLVIAEIAVAVSLSLAAVAALASLDRARSVPLGYEPAGVTALQLPRESAGKRPSPAELAFFTDLVRRIHDIPGVESLSFASSTPLSRGYSSQPFADANQPIPPRVDMKWSKLQVIGPEYFSALKIALIEGRSFREADDGKGQAVVILSRRAARQVFGEQSPLGRTILLGGTDPCEVVGVSDDVDDPHGHRVGTLFRPVLQAPGLPRELLVRASGPQAELEKALRAAVRAEDPQQPVARAARLADLLDESLWTKRMVLKLLGALAGLAVGLSLVGVYGVASRAVFERRSELGLRAALGAGPRSLVLTAVREPASVTARGALIGLGLIGLGQGAIAAAVGGGEGPPVLLCALTALVVVLVSLGASLAPAARAARISPLDALRS